mmetsp:Transcript_155054/g.495733  ORF Transcript_155054/g.495733 Transcript_155054/m.495733 type:complete len:91 (-) Transcript_155054:92-364(-)
MSVPLWMVRVRNCRWHCMDIEEFLDSGASTHFLTPLRGPVPPQRIWVRPHIADCDFYLHGPDDLLASMKVALTCTGASGVYLDVFRKALP